MIPRGFRFSAYEALLDQQPMSPAARRAAEAWLAERKRQGEGLIENRRTFAADQLKDSLARSVNAANLSEAIADAVEAGRLEPGEALRQLRDLGDVIQRSEAVVPEVQAQVAAANAADPFAELESLLSRFPAMAERVPAPPMPG